MDRREGMRLMAAAALAPLAACAPRGIRPRETDGYLMPAGALEGLRRMAVNGHACWVGGRLVSRGGSNAPFPVLSVTKSVAALAVMRALGQGWIAADEPLDPPGPRGRAEDAFTVRQLMNGTSGLPSGDREIYQARPADATTAAMRLSPVSPPGSVFRYGPASWESLAGWIDRRSHHPGRGMAWLLDRQLRDLGIRPAGWRLDGRGTPYLSTGMICGLDDLGKLGRALADLAAGRDAAGVRADVFRDLSAPRSANPMFSAGIWWNRLARMPGSRAVEPERCLGAARPPGFWKNACLQPAARQEWFALVGSGGTRVYVLPQDKVVVVIARGGGRWRDAAALERLSC